MEKVNLYINSKNRYKNDDLNHVNISLASNGLLSCNTDEYFILNINSFYILLTLRELFFIFYGGEICFRFPISFIARLRVGINNSEEGYR
jgi:hypothetical protein